MYVFSCFIFVIDWSRVFSEITKLVLRAAASRRSEGLARRLVEHFWSPCLPCIWCWGRGLRWRSRTLPAELPGLAPGTFL